MSAERRATAGARTPRGALLAALLAVAALAASSVLAAPASAHEVRPEDYRWADGRGPAWPSGREATVPVGQPTEVWTPDLHATLSLPAEALVGDADAATLAVSLQPVDAATLAAVPDGLVAAGNAYRVEVALAAPGRLILATPGPVAEVLHSTDGTAWTAIPHEVLPGRAIATVAEPGHYLAVAPPPRDPWARWGAVGSLAVGSVLLLVGARRRRADVHAVAT